jgi:hypothetical protein
MPHLNKELAINCAASFGAWSMTSGISPLVARPSASVSWLWRN